MKKNLRQEVLTKRKELVPEVVAEKSSLIINKVIALEEYQKAKTIMLYLAFRNEVDTTLLIKHAMTEGKKVVIPVSDMQNIALIPTELRNYPGDLEEGAYGILEPKKEAFHFVDPQEIDLLIVPGVAFDGQGYRLGYGAGYYDRFIPQLRTDTTILALAFELQIVQRVFPESHDKQMQFIVTEERILDFRSA
ncbi:5-formyltetrahydrofolate cyclo-ligase [Bacillota bacterium LX-D]|nr:5-formyltetrahydrofolate cyclo-ligase [Bacillota bacterium LX-D]